jgi:hypothetical protein
MIKLTTKAVLDCFSRNTMITKETMNFKINNPPSVRNILKILPIKNDGETSVPSVTKKRTDNISRSGFTSENISCFTKLSEIITPARNAPKVKDNPMISASQATNIQKEKARTRRTSNEFNFEIASKIIGTRLLPRITEKAIKMKLFAKPSSTSYKPICAEDAKELIITAITTIATSCNISQLTTLSVIFVPIFLLLSTSCNTTTVALLENAADRNSASNVEKPNLEKTTVDKRRNSINCKIAPINTVFLILMSFVIGNSIPVVKRSNATPI